MQRMLSPGVITSGALVGAFTGTGAVNGNTLAVPKNARRITVQVRFSADPGAYVMALQGSMDGTNFASLEAIAATTTGLIVSTEKITPFVRVIQTSKANSVTALPSIMVQ